MEEYKHETTVDSRYTVMMVGITTIKGTNECLLTWRCCWLCRDEKRRRIEAKERLSRDEKRHGEEETETLMA